MKTSPPYGRNFYFKKKETRLFIGLDGFEPTTAALWSTIENGPAEFWFFVLKGADSKLCGFFVPLTSSARQLDYMLMRCSLSFAAKLDLETITKEGRTDGHFLDAFPFGY